MALIASLAMQLLAPILPMGGSLLLPITFWLELVLAIVPIVLALLDSRQLFAARRAGMTRGMVAVQVALGLGCAAVVGIAASVLRPPYYAGDVELIVVDMDFWGIVLRALFLYCLVWIVKVVSEVSSWRLAVTVGALTLVVWGAALALHSGMGVWPGILIPQLIFEADASVAVFVVPILLAAMASLIATLQVRDIQPD
ncbi:hypothetical protein [Bowdeniella nasicola]|nr:hypothetical protein [Bowdeniella nasicola]